MEKKDRGLKIMAIAALLVAVVGLGVAYAGYTATLQIDGTATAKSAWDIKWTNLDSGTATGYATLPESTATDKFAIDSTTNQSIAGFVGTLRAPGDTIKYTWKATNAGEIDASITSVVLGSLSCAPATTNGSTADEAAALCNKLSVAFTYDGATATTSLTGDLLKDTSKDVTMTLSYAAGDAVSLSGDVAVTIGTTSFTYAQKATS